MDVLVVGQKRPGWESGAAVKVRVVELEDLATCCVQGQSVIYLNVTPGKAFEVLTLLRENPTLQLTPVLVSSRAASDQTLDLADGQAESLEEVVLVAGPLLELLRQVSPKIFANQSGKGLVLLTMGFTRAEQAFVPKSVQRVDAFYAWPLLESLLGTVKTLSSFFEELEERRLLRAGELVDRIRHCPKCQSVHLNFTENCPNCQSLQITQKGFLHCFTCGKVAPEDIFLQKGIMECPQCHTRLRHIGSDYDRPMENYDCSNCGHVFIEPDIRVRCMNCGFTTEPENLYVQDVLSYKLTEEGVNAVKSGEVEDLFALLDAVNHVSSTYFFNLTGWLLNICRRYTDEVFSVIGIRLENLENLQLNRGNQRAAEVLDAFAKRMRELIRTVDLTTRTGQKMFWILLPKTDSIQCKIVSDRIMKLQDMINTEEKLSFQMIIFSAPLDIRSDEDAKSLLSRLESSFES